MANTGIISAGNTQSASARPSNGSYLVAELSPGANALSIDVRGTWTGKITIEQVEQGGARSVVAPSQIVNVTNGALGIGSGAEGSWTVNLSGPGQVYVIGAADGAISWSGSAQVDVGVGPGGINFAENGVADCALTDLTLAAPGGTTATIRLWRSGREVAALTGVVIPATATTFPSIIATKTGAPFDTTIDAALITPAALTYANSSAGAILPAAGYTAIAGGSPWPVGRNYPTSFLPTGIAAQNFGQTLGGSVVAIRTLDDGVTGNAEALMVGGWMGAPTTVPALAQNANLDIVCLGDTLIFQFTPGNTGNAITITSSVDGTNFTSDTAWLPSLGQARNTIFASSGVPTGIAYMDVAPGMTVRLTYGLSGTCSITHRQASTGKSRQVAAVLQGQDGGQITGLKTNVRELNLLAATVAASTIQGATIENPTGTLGIIGIRVTAVTGNLTIQPRLLVQMSDGAIWQVLDTFTATGNVVIGNDYFWSIGRDLAAKAVSSTLWPLVRRFRVDHIIGGAGSGLSFRSDTYMVNGA